ncbi:MAG: hypothetical protein ACK4SZ_06865, partial [Allosphingosinicella sp.]|uniref:hypothetical protein n=1 Tax=Allosphingosinicella sp. TaxID=2823234 RepID=UPI0039238EA9
ARQADPNAPAGDRLSGRSPPLVIIKPERQLLLQAAFFITIDPKRTRAVAAPSLVTKVLSVARDC